MAESTVRSDEGPIERFPRGGRALADVRMLHELTKHDDGLGRHDDRLVAFRRLDPSNRPAPFKRYREVPTRLLPDDVLGSEAPAGGVLGDVPSAGQAVVDDRALARLLFLSAGVTRVAHVGAGQEEAVWFRAAMSAGNLHPVEMYVVCGELPGVPAGVHHFAPLEFGLTPLRTGDLRPVLAAAAAESSVAASPATLVLTGIPWRTAWKYAERGYRHLYWDAGSMLSNLLAAGHGAGVRIDVRAGFVDDEVCRLVGIDGTTEFPLALAVLGSGAAPQASVAVPSVDPLQLEPEPLSPHPIELPLIVDAQRAGGLPSSEAVREWRRGHERAAPAPDPVASPDGSARRSVDDIILQRGSTRRMRRAAVSREFLDWGMAVTTRPVPGDFDATLRPLLSEHVSVHAVDDVEGGAYRWYGGRGEGVRTGDFREETAQLCLGQPLGGDAAFTVFHTVPLEDVFARLGPRGYRAAQLVAGIAAGRWALAAFTLGYGASGITFFDDAVARFFSMRESCLLATAVGVPAYRNRPGGRPRAPTELGYRQAPRRR